MVLEEDEANFLLPFRIVQINSKRYGIVDFLRLNEQKVDKVYLIIC